MGDREGADPLECGHQGLEIHRCVVIEEIQVEADAVGEVHGEGRAPAEVDRRRQDRGDRLPSAGGVICECTAYGAGQAHRAAAASCARALAAGSRDLALDRRGSSPRA